MQVLWHQEQMSMLLAKGPHTLNKTKKPEENIPITWKCRASLHPWQNCLLQGKVSYQSTLAFDIYEQVINHDVLTELLVQQSNLCFKQNRRNFLNNAQEIKGFIDVSYIMAVNQLSSIPMYWDHYYFVGKVEIQNLYENKIPRSLTKTFNLPIT